VSVLLADRRDAAPFLIRVSTSGVHVGARGGRLCGDWIRRRRAHVICTVAKHEVVLVRSANRTDGWLDQPTHTFSAHVGAASWARATQRLFDQGLEVVGAHVGTRGGHRFGCNWTRVSELDERLCGQLGHLVLGQRFARHR
jgi:hypothetical protein